jgi:hypothetical protein
MKIPIGESRLLSTDLNLTELLEIEGTLILDPTKNVTLQSSKNIAVTGKLISKPNPDVVHLIRFTGINENNYQGGGDTVLGSDTGLWVMDAGQLDLLGSVINDWKRMGTDYAAMEKYAAAVGSNMRIEGTATGQAHMFIKGSQPQFIRNVAFCYMGPRKDVSGDGIKELVTGRYACHFHHSGDGSRGSIIEGCIFRDCNNHCFVPHGSHGITFRNNIIYNVLEHAVWYDFGHRTHDALWENNLVVKVGYVARALDQDSDGAPTFGAGGFVLGSGDGNVCRGNVAIGTSGDPRSAGAYIWPELRDDADNTKQLEDSWEFENNTAINCPSGLQVWQNNLHHHVVRNTTIINCPVAIFHGAYANHYKYIGGKIVRGIIDVRAASVDTNRVRFEDIDIDAAGLDYCVVLNEGPLLDDNPPAGVAPILFLHCKFTNFNKKAIIDQNPGPGWKYADVVDCGSGTVQYQVSSAALSGETIRVQYGSGAWKVTKAGASTIAKFAPSTWGTGTGLKAEYFGPDFKTKYLERIEPNVNLFDLTHPSPHYLVPTTFAARWTGKIQAQVTGNHTFTVFAGGGMKLWVNGQLLLDSWNEKYPGEFASKIISLVAGQLYDIKLEYVNTDDRSGCMLYWACGIIKKEFIPMSQLYPGEVKPPDPVPNKAPVAEAGEDQTLQIATWLTGAGKDPEGGLLTYKWVQIKGVPAVIVSPAMATTKVNNLAQGENIFRLTVTDDKGASGVDEVRVVVG